MMKLHGGILMRRVFLLLLGLVLAWPLAFAAYNPVAGARALQDGQDERRVLRVPSDGRRRRIRPEGRRGRGIKSAFARAGRGAGRGGKRFGKNMARGRPVRAGKELGKGMGTFGKYTGKGVARTAKRVFKP
jgi:hypothetical protein